MMIRKSYLNVGMTCFHILGKNIPQASLIIIRECPQNNITQILKHFNN